MAYFRACFTVRKILNSFGMSDSTTRFSARVGDYVKYRPHYPPEVLSYLQQEIRLDSSWTVADIGSGTGISTALFLNGGHKVFGIEPNREMRTKAEELLMPYSSRFISLSGTAEETGLPADSIDLIVSGQAFHWFDREKAKKEFTRIARAGAYAVLIWNERLVESDFEKDYEALILRYGGDYKTINHKNITDLQIGEFFYPQPFMVRIFDNEQIFDLEGLTGRLVSSSYIPREGDLGYDAMVADLGSVFEKYNSGDRVRIGYETKLYLGAI
jgi:SAM-dependent methyltransferase